MAEQKKKATKTLRTGKVKPGPKSDDIHREIHTAIISHKIAPGTPLQEDALAGAFGVSRTIIRKVLQRLSHERIVEIVQNKGATVAKPTAIEARQVFEARRAIEQILVERVIAHAKDSEINQLIKMVKAEQAAFERGDKEERVRLSGDFHRQLAKLSGNKVISDFLNELVSRTSLIIALYESPGAVPCSHNEHLEITDALRRRDVAKAVAYMGHHLQHVEAQVDLSESYTQADIRTVFGRRR